MNLKPITAKLTVSSQILPSELGAIGAQEFTTIIDNRPDGEGVGQPGAAELCAAAQPHGITFHYLPVAPGSVTLESAQRFGALVMQAPGRVLAYCRSGSRSEQLWATFAAQRARAGAEGPGRGDRARGKRR